ncbi:MAG: hypothetical protein AAF710_11705 [Planctomycetota bacterium]
MSEVKRLLIVVRTYPDLSTKYDETVCTAGIDEAGSWFRLYPVPLRYLAQEQRYRVGSIVRAKLSINPNDDRPESRKPDLLSLAVDKIKPSLPARHDWIVAGKTFASLNEMKAERRSIGPVAVSEVLEFIAEPQSAEWSAREEKILAQEMLHTQRLDLQKIPFKFRVRWKDADGAEQTNTFRSWEVCQTWRQWHHKYGPDEAVPRIRDKWLGEVWPSGRDVRFFLGNLADPVKRGVFHLTGSRTTPKGAHEAALF